MMEESTKEKAGVGKLLQQEDHLPGFDDLVQRFGLFSESSLCNIQIGQGGSLYCNCEGCIQWHTFVQGKSKDFPEVQYEVFTAEHVKGLAHYLLMQAEGYKLPQMNVLEVGAGSGRLFRHLQYFVSQLSLPSQGRFVKLTATDSGQKGLNGPEVEKQDAIKAVSEVRPHMVLVSWMPIGVDWTAHIRATSSVLEYILIGEIDDGICGDSWLTWGYTDADNLSDSSSDDPTSLDSIDRLPKTYTSSNYGPGRPVTVAQTETEIPIQLHSKQRSLSEQQFISPTRLGLEGRVDRENTDNDINCKKLKLDPDYLQEGTIGEDLSIAEQIPVATLASPTADDTNNGTGLRVNADTIQTVVSDMAPYAADGWVRIELASLSSLQICRTDERWSTLRHSHTVSFRRCTPCVFDRNTHKPK